MSTVPRPLFSPGAQWVRADFHLHTRADKEFQYNDEVEKFNHFYVEALHAANINVGVIANHNKFDVEEFTALRKLAKRKYEICILPGVELSVNDGGNGIHAVIVFGPTWIADGKDLITPFLTGAFPGRVPSDYQHENQSCAYNIDALLKILAEARTANNDSFIVWAHVETDKGLWQLGGSRHKTNGENAAFRETSLGFQKVGTRDKRNLMKGWLGDWYPAELEGSDPKAIAEIGRGESCFVKIGEPSFAAVRFALEDHQNRVARAAPQHTGSYIRKVQFEGGALDGQILHLSNELNTLIGIRGSGKSAILEAIRYALDIPRGLKANDIAYKDNLVRHILGSGGKVTVTAVDRHGIEYVVSRVFKQSPNVYVDGILRPGISIRETVLHKPIYFGQKDLANASEGFETDLVEKMVTDQLIDVRTRIESQKVAVRTAVQRFQKVQTTAEQIAVYTAQLTDAKHHLSLFEKYGVSGKLEKRAAFQRDVATLDRYMKVVSDYSDSLDELLRSNTEILPVVTSEHNPDLFEQFFSIFLGLEQQMAVLQTSATACKQLVVDLGAVATSLQQRREALGDEFAQVERTLAIELKREGHESVRAEEYMSQLARKTKAEEMLAALTHLDSQRDARRDALFAELESLRQLWHEEFSIIDAAIRKVNDGNLALKIVAVFKGNRAFAVNLLVDLFRGSSLRSATFEKLMEDCHDFVEVFRALHDDRLGLGASREKFDSIFLQNLEMLLTTQIPNQFTIKYHDKPLQQLSLGQRASALMVYVLSQHDNDVVFIDQPEDDLDNQSIYSDVITLLRSLKPSTQFILPTHNPNIPVLGDAEQVLVCNYMNGAISVASGSVDNAHVQASIVDIMEGGREAFDRRKKVYKQWTSST